VNVAFSARPDEENRNVGSESADYQVTPDKRVAIYSEEIRKIGVQITPLLLLWQDMVPSHPTPAN